MTTATATAPANRTSHATLSRLTFGGILRSEWIKLRSLRSTYWCFLFILVINIGFAVLLSWAIGSARGPGGQGVKVPDSPDTAMTVVTSGLLLSSLLSAVLGALVITGEYGTGMIKSTFSADPRRLGALFGKALVFGVTAFIVGLVSMVGGALAAVPGLSHNNITFDWSDGHVWLALVGGAGFLTLAGLLAFGLGAIVRVSAGGIAAGIGLLFVLPIVGSIVEGVTNAKWVSNIMAFLPSNAGGKIYAYGSGTSSFKNGLLTLDATQGLLVLIAWAVVFIALAAILVKRRDA
jgi:ABC-2 type transport system permease protein